MAGLIGVMVTISQGYTKYHPKHLFQFMGALFRLFGRPFYSKGRVIFVAASSSHRLCRTSQ
jgi:hypothetical protein